MDQSVFLLAFVAICAEVDASLFLVTCRLHIRRLFTLMILKADVEDL